MPFFGNKFSPKKPPPRKTSINGNAEEIQERLLNENRSVRLLLGHQECTFDNGQWIPSSGSHNNKVIQKLEKKIEELEEENNMLRLRYQIVLDMLSETTAESNLQQLEIEKLRKK
ncbi:protein chibby homolog 1 [Onthophagus taurus]|uniref:protein chibby homolog 1 n=1 Tax=Onthophagus taurus TaxID=166361 RepID=UPI000C2047F0|nr:protein chibby homolog 1 [Onthophagus taurus]